MSWLSYHRGSRVKLPLVAVLGSVIHFHYQWLGIGFGEPADPRSVPRGNFTLEHPNVTPPITHSVSLDAGEARSSGGSTPTL